MWIALKTGQYLLSSFLGCRLGFWLVPCQEEPDVEMKEQPQEQPPVAELDEEACTNRLFGFWNSRKKQMIQVAVLALLSGAEALVPTTASYWHGVHCIQQQLATGFFWCISSWTKQSCARLIAIALIKVPSQTLPFRTKRKTLPRSGMNGRQRLPAKSTWGI